MCKRVYLVVCYLDHLGSWVKGVFENKADAEKTGYALLENFDWVEIEEWKIK